MTALPVKTETATASNTLARPFSDPSLASLRNALGWVAGKPALMTGANLTETTRRRLHHWQMTLKSRLCCGATDDRDKAVEIAKLTSAFPQQGQDQVSSDLRIETYFDALNGLPAWAVREARQAIVRGETGYGRPWGPGPIEFADLVRECLKPVSDDLRDVETLLLAEPIEGRIDEHERDRIAAGFAKLKSELGPKKQSAHSIYEDAMAGLQARATANGVDLQTALDAIPDAPERSGTFRKPAPPPGN